MPHIKNVTISGPSTAQGSGGTNDFPAHVSATVKFSALEQSLGLSYQVKFALYEVDDTMDVYSAFPNNHDLFLQRASRGDKDDFVGMSRAQTIKADAAEKTIDHSFNIRVSFEADQQMELKALAVCVPETATAMKWSSTKRVGVVAG